jgi:hypothetical protein
MVAVREALMTVLNFLLTNEAVYLLTDTVLSDPDDLSPIAFTTKVHPLPHLQAVICGTGHAQMCAMQRIPGPGKSATVQTSLAICHTFPDFEEICARAAARPPGS